MAAPRATTLSIILFLAFLQNVCAALSLIGIVPGYDVYGPAGSSLYGSYGIPNPMVNNHVALATKTDSVVDKVVGGTLAVDGQFPWMAVIHRPIGGSEVSMCGGTILSKRWILTAGHCVANGPLNFNIYLGVTDKSGIGYNYYHGDGVSLRTTQGALHPQYGEGSNDIALLYMPQDITFNAKIQPIRLAGKAQQSNSYTNAEGYVIGWGLDGTRITENQKHLKFGVLKIISDDECRRFWGINAGNICTAPETGQDACQGDSGGPLVVISNNQTLQIGIVSYGDAGCPSSKAGVYTKVTHYVDWIGQVTGIHYT